MSDSNQKLGKYRIVKALVYFLVGLISFPGIAIFNKLRISGMDKLHKLPHTNVLFVSNHQTYFADVITFLHIFCAVKWRRKKGLGVPIYLLNPFTRVKYVAAAETMRSSFLAKFFTLAGAITVKRTWAKTSKETRKGLEVGDARQILEALNGGWVITFPQGTTTAFAEGRKGTAFCVKQHHPLVVPVVIDGFSKAFDKKGLKMKKWGTILSVKFKDPVEFEQEESIDDIHEKLMDAIEQSNRFRPVTDG